MNKAGLKRVLFGASALLFLGASFILSGGHANINAATILAESDTNGAKSGTPEAPAPNAAKPEEGAGIEKEPATQNTEPGPMAKDEAKPVKPALVLQLKPPYSSSEEFVNYAKAQRNEDQNYLEQRYQRAMLMIENQDLYREKELAAFLKTPREKFCRKWNLKRAYDHAFLDIKYGVTISGPHLVGRMTSALDVQPGEKVLEVGTGSGYQSAVLSNLTDKVYTIEIIEPLAKETDALYTELVQEGYKEYDNIKRKADDGYYGWEEYAPFDKIIVTCGIDHIPPPLLKQLKVGGSMVIPVGPPGAQIVLRVTKNQDEQGNFTIAREDIYFGKKKVPFVPFTKKGGGTHFK